MQHHPNYTNAIVCVASTTDRKLQLQQDLNNIRQKDMSVTDYTTKIKEICDALGSINVTMEEDEMVQICLGGLTQRYGKFRQRYAPGRCHRLLRLAIDADGRRKPHEWVEDHVTHP